MKNAFRTLLVVHLLHRPHLHLALVIVIVVVVVVVVLLLLLLLLALLAPLRFLASIRSAQWAYWHANEVHLDRQRPEREPRAP